MKKIRFKYTTTFFGTFFCILLLSFMIFSQAAFAAPKLDEYNFVPLIFEGKDTGIQACTIKGNAYIPIDALKEYGDCSSFTIDTAKKQILLRPAEMDLYIGDPQTTDFIKTYAGTCYTPLKTIDNKLYISLNLIKDLADLTFTADEGNTASNKAQTSITFVEMKRASQESGSAFLPYKTTAAGSLLEGSDARITLKQNEEVSILGETENFYKVETLSGDVCYVLKSEIEFTEGGTSAYDYIFTAKKKKTIRNKFNMVWFSANSAGISALPPDEAGVDVVAPVWMNQIVEGNGNISVYGDRGFVDLCHERGKQVWICFTNDMTTTGSTNYTSKVLADEDLRRKTIAQYLFYACLYDADGLNIDYEDIKVTDGDNLTIFTQELYHYCSRLGLVLSTDVYVPNIANRKIYQYAEIADHVDYECVMSYDQHWSSGPDAGSISAQDWYIEAFEELITYCPSEKLIMGVPFYTRIWQVDSNGKKISGTAYTMGNARIKVERSGVTPVWLPVEGQYYAEYTEGGKRYQVWLEDKRSIATRLSNVYYYDLAGTGCWRYGQQENGILDVFDAINHDGISPGSFTDPY